MLFINLFNFFGRTLFNIIIVFISISQASFFVDLYFILLVGTSDLETVQVFIHVNHLLVRNILACRGLSILFLESKEIILINLAVDLHHRWTLKHILILLKSCLLLKLLEILLMISLIVDVLVVGIS
jgi:hypothetical protein